MVRLFLIALLAVCCSGCCLLGIGTHYTEFNGQVNCVDENCGFGGPVCTVYDPKLKQQVPIDSSTGVVNTCTTTTHTCTVYLIERTQCYTCQSTYTDSMGNTWQGQSYDERVTPQ